LPLVGKLRNNDPPAHTSKVLFRN